MRFCFMLLSLVLSLAGCTLQSQPVLPDFFSGQDQFAARRERQTSSFDGIDYDTMLGHIVESLLDLDCTLEESNKAFGVISARGSTVRNFRGSCAGHNVTVKVTQMAEDKLDVRATFQPPNPKAVNVFNVLIERSIAQSRGSKAP